MGMKGNHNHPTAITGATDTVYSTKTPGSYYCQVGLRDHPEQIPMRSTTTRVSINTSQSEELSTVEPLNNGHVGDEHFVHCSEVFPSLEVEMYVCIGRGQAVCPL